MLSEITISTKNKYQLADLTNKINKLLHKQKIKNGFATIQTPHATVGLFLDEFEKNLNKDFIKTFSKMLPDQKYLHDKIDNNAKAHILSGIYGTNLTLIIRNNQFIIGKFQHIIFAEFDGPRKDRKIIIKFINT